MECFCEITKANPATNSLISCRIKATNVQENRDFRILMMCSNYAKNISMIIGSMMATSMMTYKWQMINYINFEVFAEPSMSSMSR